MDKFSRDLTVALEETSLMDRAYGIGRWGSRRRTRSTGNLPSAPQPTEDSLSSPTETTNIRQLQQQQQQQNSDVKAGCRAVATIDVLNVSKVCPRYTDSEDEKGRIIFPLRLPNRTIRLGGLESDSLNENNFSPARFLRLNSRRRRKSKRIPALLTPHSSNADGATIKTHIGKPIVGVQNCVSVTKVPIILRKRIMHHDTRTSSSFCGKRKRSNRDRYHDQEHLTTTTKIHSFNNTRHMHNNDNQMRPRSFSSTSKPNIVRLLPLNKGLLSKIERISKIRSDGESAKATQQFDALSIIDNERKLTQANSSKKSQVSEIRQTHFHHAHRRKIRVSNMPKALSADYPSTAMDCTELYEFLSSSSISSSSGSEDENCHGDSDREGDDELTDWPGNDFGPNSKYDAKRKLMKKSTLPQIKSDDTLGEDDTLMSVNDITTNNNALTQSSVKSLHVQTTESLPDAIKASYSFVTFNGDEQKLSDMCNLELRPKQIESEMSGETSNPIFPLSPAKLVDVREIRAGCRRIKGERPGFSIKLSVNELLARFLQDPRQSEIRLPDIEIYEHESLVNLAMLYSLSMKLEKGCAVLSKTSNTTQSVNIDQRRLRDSLSLSDFKRRCYDGNDGLVPQK